MPAYASTFTSTNKLKVSLPALLVLLSFPLELLADPILYEITAEVSFVSGSGPFGTSVSISNALTGTATFDADAASPWSDVSFAVNGNTYELKLDAGTHFEQFDAFEYKLGFNVGSANPSNSDQWIVNGANTLYAPGGNGQSHTIIFKSDLTGGSPLAPFGNPLRTPDSPEWASIDILLGGTLFNNETFTAVPEPATGILMLLGLAGATWYRRSSQA